MEFDYDFMHRRYMITVDACKKEKREDNHRNMGYLSRLRKTLES